MVNDELYQCKKRVGGGEGKHVFNSQRDRERGGEEEGVGSSL